MLAICSSQITALRKKKNGDLQVIGKDTEQKLYVKRKGKTNDLCLILLSLVLT